MSNTENSQQTEQQPPHPVVDRTVVVIPDLLGIRLPSNPEQTPTVLIYLSRETRQEFEAVGLRWATLELPIGVVVDSLSEIQHRPDWVRRISINQMLKPVADGVELVTALRNTETGARYATEGTLPAWAITQILEEIHWWYGVRLKPDSPVMRLDRILRRGPALLNDEQDALISDVVDAVTHADDELRQRAEAKAAAEEARRVKAEADRQQRQRKQDEDRRANQGGGRNSGRDRLKKQGSGKATDSTIKNGRVVASSFGDIPKVVAAAQAPTPVEPQPVPEPHAPEQPTPADAKAGQVIPPAPEELFVDEQPAAQLEPADSSAS